MWTEAKHGNFYVKARAPFVSAFEWSLKFSEHVLASYTDIHVLGIWDSRTLRLWNIKRFDHILTVKCPAWTDAIPRGGNGVFIYLEEMIVEAFPLQHLRKMNCTVKWVKVIYRPMDFAIFKLRFLIVFSIGKRKFLK